jgi:hypothetical protein
MEEGRMLGPEGGHGISPPWRCRRIPVAESRSFGEKFEQPGCSGSERRRMGKERGRGGLIGEVLKTIYSRNEEGSDHRRTFPETEREGDDCGRRTTVLMGGSRWQGERGERDERGGLVRLVWAPGAAQLGCALLLSLFFVLIPFSYFLISCFRF